MTVIMKGNKIGPLESLIMNEKANWKRTEQRDEKKYIKHPGIIETTFYISLKGKAIPRKKYVC